MTPQQYALIHRLAVKLQCENHRVDYASDRLSYWQSHAHTYEPEHLIFGRQVEANDMFDIALTRFRLCEKMLARRLKQVDRNMIIVDDCVFILGDHDEIALHFGVATAIKEAANFALPSDRLNLEA